MIRTQGRGLKSGRVSIIPSGTGLTIRVDDDERPEFWLTIEMNTIELEQWARLCRLAEEGAQVDALAATLYGNERLPDRGGDK